MKRRQIAADQQGVLTRRTPMARPQSTDTLQPNLLSYN
jgi:hypothetical protein